MGRIHHGQASTPSRAGVHAVELRLGELKLQYNTAALSKTLLNTTFYSLLISHVNAYYILDVSLYGSHPFFIQIASDGKAHGVMLMNSNSMDVTLSNSDTQGETIGIQATGGIIDLYIFAGPTPSAVIAQYLEVIGRPAMVPYWSLGFHNCRWGYPNIAYVEEVVANYSVAMIPLETQWMDIDYMSHYLDFTLDASNFPTTEVQSFIATLHANNQHFIPIVDPGIYTQQADYDAYTNGMAQNIFVKDLNGVDPFLGVVWPGPVYVPDWFATNATNWWTREISDFQKLAAFDGLYYLCMFCFRNDCLTY